MTTDPAEWRSQVRDAALRGEQDELRRLYAASHDIFGSDADAEWARTLSALDSSAITG